MQYPLKYINFIQFLLEKRKQIDGFDTPIIFNIEELESYGLNNMEEIKKMLTVMSHAKVAIKNELDETERIKLFKYYIITEENITIYECSTPQLKSYLIKVKKKHKKSEIMVEKYKQGIKIRYANGGWITFSNALPRKVFVCLYNNYPDTVKFETLYKEIKNNTMLELNSLAKREKIQKIISGIYRRIKKTNIPTDFITSVRDVGYKLQI